MPENKGKHLDRMDRDFIEMALKEGMSFRDMARHLCVSPTTIGKEIERNRTFVTSGKSMSLSRKCARAKSCSVTALCADACSNPRGGRCASCRMVGCINLCRDFQPRTCERLTHAPFVCEGCKEKGSCVLDHACYLAASAQRSCERRARESRLGIDCPAADLEHMVVKVRKLLAQGQSIQAIWMTHEDEFPVGERTFYNYMHLGVMGMTLLELRDSVQRRPRKKADARQTLPKAHFNGRTYADWCALDEEQKLSTVEMDCVEGRAKDTQVILSLHFKRYSFQLYVLLPDHTAASVVAAIDAIELYCEGRFPDVFGVILTDRGHEFTDFAGIERGGRCRVFYCDPMEPGQKASCERNHVELRKILPKKVSDFDALSPWDVAEVCSHVNSYPRASLGGATPIALASQVLPKSLLESLGIRQVPPDDVVLRPSVLDKTR